MNLPLKKGAYFIIALSLALAFIKWIGVSYGLNIDNDWSKIIIVGSVGVFALFMHYLIVFMSHVNAILAIIHVLYDDYLERNQDPISQETILHEEINQ